MHRIMQSPDNFPERKSGKKMIDLVITVCEWMGPAAVVAISLTLLGIALEKIRV